MAWGPGANSPFFVYMHFLNLQMRLMCQEWDLTHNKCEFSKCMGIMLANLCQPYIVSITVFTDQSAVKFLNGKLKEEIYMDQSSGYVQSGMENLVC